MFWGKSGLFACISGGKVDSFGYFSIKSKVFLGAFTWTVDFFGVKAGVEGPRGLFPE